MEMVTAGFSCHFTAACWSNDLLPPPGEGGSVAAVHCAVPGDHALLLLAPCLLLLGPVLLSPPCAGCCGAQYVSPGTQGARDGAVSACVLLLDPEPLLGAGVHRGGFVDGDEDCPLWSSASCPGSLWQYGRLEMV